jgi:glycosyltransferase involved in cell wall biosynthesis
MAQSAPTEVLVIDDASTDGTSEMLAAEFPGARVVRVEASEGYIVQRNKGAWLASAPVIFSIDDDAEFSTPYVVEQTLRDFDDPRVGAVAIPHVNVNKSPKVETVAPNSGGVFVTAMYIGTAHAVRRELFLSLGGYREFFFHQAEEPDFCLRLLAAGHVTRLGRSDPIRHYESPQRSRPRLHIFGTRNVILSAWCNVPMPWLVPQWAGTVVRAMTYPKLRLLGWHAQGLAKGFAAAWTNRRQRRPVPAAIYRLNRRLRRSGCLPIEAIEAELAPARARAASHAEGRP